MRKTDPTNSRHSSIIPHRNYFSTEVEPVSCGEIYAVDVELWPTNVVAAKGDSIIFEISSCDTQGSGIFLHSHEEDRAERIFKGQNHIHFGSDRENFLILPIVP